MAGKKIVFVDSDILVIGGGFGGCGAAYESRYWGRDKKIVVVEGAPQGLDVRHIPPVQRLVVRHGTEG